MKDVHLYINDKEVDLNDDSLILYNWSETDLSNPTTTTNSFSKTISLPSTKRNAKVFSHLWNLERVQTYNDGSINPSRRIPFRITYDGDNIFEDGYCKLQNVKMVNGVYQYEISLFGQIGNFLNNLSTNYTDGSIKTLADLRYYDDNGEEVDMDFVINLDTVQEAWEYIGRDKWGILNFADTYNGVPSSMDADKVLVDGVDGFSPFLKHRHVQDGVEYLPISDRTVMKTPSKMSKDETKDYRSYLLTPVINCQKIMEAIARPENNSGEYDNGFEVELDPTFFSYGLNPYMDAWMTLPSITSIKLTNTSSNNTETVITNMSFVKKERIGDSYRFIYNIALPEVLTEWADFEMTVSFGNLFNYPTWYTRSEMYMRSDMQKTANYINADAIQAYAITNDGADDENIVAGGNLVWLTSDNYAHFKNGNTQVFTYENAVNHKGYVPKANPDSVSSSYKALWKKLGGNSYHTLVTDENDNYEIKLRLTAPVGSKNIRICVDMVKGYKGFGDSVFLFNPFDDYKTSTAYRIDNIGYSSILCKYKSTDSYYSNKLITKQNLLTTNYSVRDWLLSYCKMFGLYIWYDKDTERLHIDTRETFYKRNIVRNISDSIDMSKEYTIKPVIAENNFYTMTQEQVASDLADDYKTIYAHTYGTKVIDTGANLEPPAKELMTLKFKSGIMSNNQSRYNFKPTVVEGASGVTPYMCDGITYMLYNGDNTYEMKKEALVLNDVFANDWLGPKEYSDFMDKVRFQKEDKPVDGSNVLLFYCGDEYVKDFGYYLSDDIPAMSSLNGKPTWLLTNDFSGKTYVKKLEYIPSFSRYVVSNGNVIFSLDFGSPRKLYIDNVINRDSATLYKFFYESYYTDLFDVNTKQLTCYWKPNDILSIKELQKFYWFDNSLWRLNRIIDYDPQSPDTVKVEFIKVNDVAAITSEAPSKILHVDIELDSYSIGYTGGTIIGSVTTSDYGPWTAGSDYLYITPNSSWTNSDITIDVPANDTQEDMTHQIGVEAGDVSTATNITQPAGFGVITTIYLTVTNLYPQSIRIGLKFYYDYGYTYRTIPSGESMVITVPIPYNGWSWNYDLMLEDVYGNFETEKLTLNLNGGGTIVDYDINDFMEQAKNIGADKFRGSTLIIEEA